MRKAGIEVYALLRYGVPVRIEAGEVTETVHLINWGKPEKNDFAIAEEVTPRGNQERLDRHMPQWRHHRAALNRLPVRHESWEY
ncbi:MAG: hypothetical protein HY897_00460 [Deltaproteobacteria bacterium]|nr:hypothetical protein [Deltaproteobacteria bacterium]